MIESLVSSLDIGLQETVALAAVTLIGYLVGQRTRRPIPAEDTPERHAEMERAARIARQLENIAASLRQELASHHAQVARFKKRLRAVSNGQDEGCWTELCDEAELMLGPTLQLASQLSHAYDQIRRQSNALLTFAEGRTDPVTGVGNGHALEELLSVLLPAMSKGGAGFSLALIHVSGNQSTEDDQRNRSDDQLLQEVASLIQHTMREDDFVARYGADEFVVIMPQTILSGARVFGERLNQNITRDLDATLSCGIAEANADDNAKTLLGRADSALYSAKAAGGNRLFVHTGTAIKEHSSNKRPSLDVVDEQDNTEDDAMSDADEPAVVV